MMDLATTYMGLDLGNPLVASASPLSYTLDGVRRLADAGVGRSCCTRCSRSNCASKPRERPTGGRSGESFAEAVGYFPAAATEDPAHADI